MKFEEERSHFVQNTTLNFKNFNSIQIQSPPIEVNVFKPADLPISHFFPQIFWKQATLLDLCNQILCQKNQNRKTVTTYERKLAVVTAIKTRIIFATTTKTKNRIDPAGADP